MSGWRGALSASGGAGEGVGAGGGGGGLIHMSPLPGENDWDEPPSCSVLMCQDFLAKHVRLQGGGGSTEGNGADGQD
eukprot:4044302-Prymnesium_polylepis.1